MNFVVFAHFRDGSPSEAHYITGVNTPDEAEACVSHLFAAGTVSYQVRPDNHESTRTTPHIRVALPTPKGKRHKVVSHNVSKEFAGDAIALYRRDKETGEFTGELGLAKQRHRGVMSAPLPNALKIKSPVAEADTKRFIAVPRRTFKGVMDMSTKGHRAQYQGMVNGKPVWGHATV